MPFSKHPETLEEAIEEECDGFSFRGHGVERDIFLQLASSELSGLGVKVAANSSDLELPDTKDLKRRILLKWEGTLYDTRMEAKRNTYTGPDGEKAEVVEAGDRFVSPIRCPAQLVACASITYSLSDLNKLSLNLGIPGTFDIEHTDSNCELVVLNVGPTGELWPCIVQTKRIKRNEHLRYMYTCDMATMLFNCIVEWSKATHTKRKADRTRTGARVDGATNRLTKRRRGTDGRYVTNEY